MLPLAKHGHRLLKNLVLVACAMAFLPAPPAIAMDLTVSLGKIPGRAETGADGQPTGDYVRLFQLIDEAYEEGALTIGVYPFARSVNNLQQGKAEIHFPLVRPQDEQDAPFLFVPEPVFHPVFVLYSRSDAPLGPEDDLSTKRIETVGGSRTRSFSFSVGIAENPEAGLRKLSLGRIDGYIGEQSGTDAILKDLGLRNIHRELFRVVEIGIAVQKTDEGNRLAGKLVEVLQELKQEPGFREFISSVYGAYEDWQPYW